MSDYFIIRDDCDHFKSETKKICGDCYIKTLNELAQLRKENEELKNELLDVLDFKNGKGTTVHNILSERIKKLEEGIKKLQAENERLTKALNDIVKEGYEFHLHNPQVDSSVHINCDYCKEKIKIALDALEEKKGQKNVY